MRRFRSRIGAPSVRVAAAVVATLALGTGSVLANVALTKLSGDPYTNPTSQHATEVEPDSFSFGSTIVVATQVGRFDIGGGASNIGWATSINGGSSWTNGFLPGTTQFASPAGDYERATDPAVGYDAKHNVWMISTLVLTGGIGMAVLTSRSTDGGLTWGNPVAVSIATGKSNYDKNWIACDDTSTSPFYGNCYTEWDDFGLGDRILMSTSIDGGLTWGPPVRPHNNATGLGGQPLVRPDGTVIVPIANGFESSIRSFVSTDGGASWGKTITVSKVKDHAVAGNLRSGPLPSAEMDGSGTAYVVWEDCRFRAKCASNDIVMSTSSDGLTWSDVVRIPIDAADSTVDHFIPGLAVDRDTSGSTAHLALAYYYYPDAECTSATCELDVGYVSSTDAGATWSATPTQIAGPMNLAWLPSTSQGPMVGDYISTSFVGGVAFPIVIVANAPTGSTFDEALYTTSGGLSALSATTVAAALGPVVASESDHPASTSARANR